jgi:hypothetical protein
VLAATTPEEPPPVDHTPPPICGDVRAWCETHPDATYRVIVGDHRIDRAPPQTIEPEVHEVFERYYEVSAPEEALVGVCGASLAANGLIFLPDGSLAGEVVTHMLEFRPLILANEPAYVRPLPTTVRKQAGNYYSLVIGNYANYFHWLLDVMIRLPAVLPHLPADTRFIVPPKLKDFHNAMLAVVGIKPQQLCVYPPTEVWTCERLFFCVPYFKPMLHSAEHMNAFANLCLSAFDVTDRSPANRIFISRQLDNHWRISNEADVTDLLERYGFETYQLSEMTFEQQVALFARAELIVGTGAGLSNMVFAPPTAKILQIQEPTYPVGHHFTICRALDHPYWYFFGDAVPNPESRYGRADIFVPLDKLQESLDQMLAGTQ